MGNPYAAKTSAAPKKSAKVEKKEAVVPGGTIKEVRDWVGDDKERAARALEEEKKGANRKTLITDLEEVLEEEETDLDD